ncbi:uncharacterized protein LOC116305921 [Actinia tenebrosa]|uniref:Uncharacterized protein LOC116305921 n=1 Tax=Actinia tenebrosa TaxID=6105 RepID=A0A6P8J0W5_ACTTE|nr:uncharacterized protein LOC116305921 [Actinia tenebrosa]
MKRRLAFLIFFLVAWQLASSQAVVDHGLNGDINPVLPHEGTVFESNPIDNENANVKFHVEDIPDKNPLYAGDLTQLPKPVEENIAQTSTQYAQSITNGQTLSPKETSTRVPLPKTPQQHLPTEALTRVAQSVHNIQPVDNVQINSNQGASTGAKTVAEHLQMSAKNIETPLVVQNTHHIPLGDNVYDGNRKGTSTSIPTPVQGITPPPIFMLDSGLLKSFTKPSKDIQSTTKTMQGDFATKVSPDQASSNAEQKTDSERNNPVMTQYSVKDFTHPILKLAEGNNAFAIVYNGVVWCGVVWCGVVSGNIRLYIIILDNGIFYPL